MLRQVLIIAGMVASVMLYKPLVVEGHRGAISRNYENSLEAFLEAERLGIDGIEYDLWLLSDGIPVIVHGKSANGLEVLWNVEKEVMETKFLPLMTSVELQTYRYPDKKTRVPLFEEVLVALKNSRLYLNSEIKDCRPELVRAVLTRIKDISPTCHLVFSSFNHKVRQMIDDVRLELELPDFSFGFLVGLTQALPPLVDGKPIFMRKGDTLNIDITMVLADDPGLADYLTAVRNAGFHIKVYNLMGLTEFEDAPLYQRLSSYGADTFICNNVERLMDYNRKLTVTQQ
jgi:glycerophosphoryl diester phosphodiesterase